MDEIKVQLDEGAYLPVRAYESDAGADLRTPRNFVLRAKSHITIDTGVHFEIPEGYAMIIKGKSGLMTKHGIYTDATIDAGYSGSVRVVMFNFSNEHLTFRKGDKIAQIAMFRVSTPAFRVVDKIAEGERGDNGFGSTGK